MPNPSSPEPAPTRSLDDFDFARVREIGRLEQRLHFVGRNQRVLAVAEAACWAVLGTACMSIPLWSYIVRIFADSAWIWLLFNAVLIGGLAYPTVRSSHRHRIGTLRLEIKRLRAGHRRLIRGHRGKDQDR